MRQILRYLYRHFLPANLRQSLDLFPYLRTTTSLEGVTEKKILVLSPHADDDVIGCGGTLYLSHLQGAEITSLYLTDGRKGNLRYNEEALVSIRREEAERAAKIIGIDRLLFLNNKDSELSPSLKTIAELSTILQDLKPEAVFLPFFLDNHPDHMATNRIFLSALKTLPPFLCYTYGIWTPLPRFNLSIDITPCIEVKRKALEEYKSQREVFDLIDVSLGLSKYYSLLSGSAGKGWVEVYLVCPSSEYRRLAEVIEW